MIIGQQYVILRYDFFITSLSLPNRIHALAFYSATRNNKTSIPRTFNADTYACNALELLFNHKKCKKIYIISNSRDLTL